ncbi:outer membrane beta-barrel protein [Winogradskyella sp. PE311]|uniref:outer membrane beta-barrel protein n=1 Tax=Winogradskyella sp. PE311 TaxID=3366943 RepID=UPI00397F7AD6
MKKLILLICFLSLGHLLFAQTQLGIKGGLNFTFFKVTEGGFGTNPESDIGFYGGVFVDFKIDNGFHIQPELLYKGVGDFEFINAPIYLKYDIYDSLHILVGPSLNYFFDIFNNSFKVRADVSLEYDFGSKLSAHMKYTLGFEELSADIIFIGLGYRL